MTRYTVEWSPVALDQLADLWSEADDRNAVADASDRIDQLLVYNPERKGVA